MKLTTTRVGDPSLLGSREEFLAPFDTVFDTLMGRTFPEFSREFGVNFFEKSAYPKVNIIDYSDSIQIEAELPGHTKESISIGYDDKILTISGNNLNKADESADIKNGTAKYILKELKRSSFKRSFTLDADLLDTDSIQAKFDSGVLHVCVPKRKQRQTEKKIINID
jgi:HSP20 family protein